MESVNVPQRKKYLPSQASAPKRLLKPLPSGDLVVSFIAWLTPPTDLLLS